MKILLLLAISWSIPSLIIGRIDTVDDLDLNKYAGRWYEIYNSLIQRWTFQKNLHCTTADYTLKDGYIDVINAGRKNSATGELSRAHGEAKVLDKKKPGALSVNFDSTPAIFKANYANYLVIKLGPVINNQYQYSVITSPFKAFVWVLARDQKLFKEKYEKEVLEFLQKNGFVWFWNKPRKSDQEADCTYPKPI